MEEGEALVADVGGVAVLTAMTCAGVVDMDIGAGGKTGEQELVFFLMERFVALGEETAELTGGDVDTPLA